MNQKEQTVRVHRLKRDLRDREVTTVGRDGPRASATKYCRTAKAGEWAETGEQTPEPAQAAKQPKQSLTCKVQTFTIYTVIPFTSREQNQSIYRWVRSILFKDRHEQNSGKRKTKMWGIFFTKRNPKIAAVSFVNGQKDVAGTELHRLICWGQ